MRTSPSSGWPPSICSLSTRSLRRLCSRRPLLWRECLDRERVDLTSDALAQCAIHQLVARERAQTGKRGTHEECAEMDVVLGMHLDPCVREGLANQLLNLLWVHAD